MRAVILGTDFVKDIDGSFKTLETNTNVGLEISFDKYVNDSFKEFIISNNFTEIVIIYNTTNTSPTENIDIYTHNKFGKNIMDYCQSLSAQIPNLQVNEHRLDLNAVTIPYIEDADNRLIIRITFDTTALLDDEYARDNWSYLSLMYNDDVNSIPKTYINDTNFGLDSIGNTLRDNGNHPNYVIKKRITPSDNTIYPKLYKINNLEELNNLKQNLEVDEYIQEYVLNKTELFENRLNFFRSVDLIYGSELNILNLWCTQKTNLMEFNDETPDYDDNNLVQKWDRPIYLPKYINGTSDISVKLDVDSNSKILIDNNTIITADNLQSTDIIKTIHFNSLDNLEENQYLNWSSSYQSILSTTEISSSSISDKATFDYVGKIVNLVLDNNCQFSDVPHALIFKKQFIKNENEEEIESVVFSTYEDIKLNDDILIYDINSNSIICSKVINIFYNFDILKAYRISLTKNHIFLTLDESSNSQSYGILTHNYDYDCRYAYCPPGPYLVNLFYGGGWARTCNTGYDLNCFDSIGSACIRWGGPYGTTIPYCGYIYGSAGDSFCGYCCEGSMGDYCNGNKPSDERLKKNIKYIRTLPSGLKIYEFEFIDYFVEKQKELYNKDYSGKWEGVIAQDLINTKYESALNLREEDGYFEVNYELIEIKLKNIQ